MSAWHLFLTVRMMLIRSSNDLKQLLCYDVGEYSTFRKSLNKIVVTEALDQWRAQLYAYVKVKEHHGLLTVNSFQSSHTADFSGAT